ncbi:MAG: MFS transporter [Acidobacteria bacterium]|nr:MAG: MFS transporter [Acidobacteriota bacterium]
MARKSIYYGWANLAVAALAMVGTLPGRTQGLGLVTESLLSDLRIDRVPYAAINLWATLIGAAFCLPCGRLVDRFGSRIVLTTVVLALGASVLAMSSAGGLVALCITLTLTRGFGQSALSVVSLALVGKWFARRLNYAMGVYSLLVGIGFIAAFPSIGQAVLRFGWRTTWSGVGWFLLLGLMPVAWLVVRNHPEDRGLAVDGDDQCAEARLSDLNVWQALRSPAFWVFALASSVFGLVYSGISLFNESILVERGFDASTYHTVLAVSTFLGLLANFGGGWLASRWPIQRLMGLGMAVLGLALLALPLVRTFIDVMLYGVAMGVAGGVVTVVFFSVWGQVFGRGHLGRIQGCAQMMTVFASAVGPLLLAETLRQTGSYDLLFYGLAVVVALLGFACWYVVIPSREASGAQAIPQAQPVG